MKFPLLSNLAVTDEERTFVESQCDGGNSAHQQRIAAEIYSAAMYREAAKSSEKYTRRMLWWTALMAIASLIQVFVAYRSLNLQNFANAINSILTDNSKRELETSKKKLSFDIINTLYKDFYQFSNYNSEVIRKLKAKEQINNLNNLATYINGFEDLYEQCKRGLINREDVRMHFEYLIGPTCNNSQVEATIGDHGNGLKLLCNSFYPGSRLAKKAKIEKDACN